MKVAVVGCGAVGSYYGAMLCRDGLDVHFLLRSDYEAVRRHGVFIRSAAGDFNARPRCARTPAEIGLCDLVLVALKATANDQFSKLLPPLVGPHTAVMTLQNGLGNEEHLARLFPAGQVVGGICFVCLNRVAPGVIEHIAEGTIMLGEFGGWPEPRTQDFATMFRHAGVPSKVTDNLARSRWEKLVWNIPFNGLGVAGAQGYDALVSQPSTFNPQPTPGLCLTTDKLLGDPRWEKLVRELMLEVITAARAQGLEIPESLAERHIARTRPMGAYKASTLLDFEQGRPLELESVFLEPLRRAQRAGVATPRLAAVCAVLKQLEARRASVTAVLQ
ncbi:MAG: 2-dehydropantoate 2-reductase [Pedosphaera sp.]|nr:2-dehydropantoate 2-reductase [Pedosphaera sp.]